MVEYHNNQTPVRDSSAATMFFVFLAIVVIVVGAIYLFPRLRNDTDTNRDVNVQVDTPDLPVENTPVDPGETGTDSGTAPDTGTQP